MVQGYDCGFGFKGCGLGFWGFRFRVTLAFELQWF